MTSSAISPIRTRLADIVADLNQALAVARQEGDPVQISVVKMLGDPPIFHVALLPPPEPPKAATTEPAPPAEPVVTDGGTP
jgi:hypothetical protein